MLLILALGTTYITTYQNVSAVGDGSVSNTIRIDDNTLNGPILNNEDRFGRSIANIGDLNNDGINDIAMGAIYDNRSGFVLGQGAIHIMFMNIDGSVSKTVDINHNTPNGPALSNYDHFGSSIANIGDLNNDGINDIAVGATFNSASGYNNGAIHIMFMNTDGSVSKSVEINHNTPNGPALSNYDHFGSSIANIGDLNKDGINDIVVGAYDTDGDDGYNVGAIHVLFMNTDGSVSKTVEINQNTPNAPALNKGDHFGSSITNTGDLNGDGISDIAVGAHGDDSNIGAIHILFMNTDGSVSQTVKINDNTPNGPALNEQDYFGRSIANIGDLNGDGISDIAVGAVGDSADGVDRGAIHILFMNTGGLVSKTVEINGNTQNGPTLGNYDYFGQSIANIGDLNNDGMLDIAVGSVGSYSGTFTRGAIDILIMNNTDAAPPVVVPIFNVNLLNDPYSLSSWTIHSKGGNGWLDSSSGKKNWVPSKQAFATSFGWAEKSQLVPIPSTYGKLVLTEDYSKTYCGEKKGVPKNNPPYDRYYLALLLLDSSGNEIERHVTGQIKMKDSCNWSRNWHTAEIVVDSIPKDTVSALVKHGGISAERWAGWYGPVMKDIKLVYASPLHS